MEERPHQQLLILSLRMEHQLGIAGRRARTPSAVQPAVTEQIASLFPVRADEAVSALVRGPTPFLQVFWLIRVLFFGVQSQVLHCRARRTFQG